MISSTLIFYITLHKTIYKNSSLWKCVSKFHKFNLKLSDKLKFTQNFLKIFSCLFSIYIFFFRISTKFTQNCNQKLTNTLNEWHSIIHSFLFIMFCISPISGFFPSIFLFQACKMGSEKWTQWIWMKIAFLKGLCSWHRFVLRMKPFYLPTRN